MLKTSLYAAVLAIVCAPCAAPAYPTKPIRLVVPFPAGGGVDLLGSTPEEFTAYIRSELKKWGDVVKMASIKAE